jgi:4-hydroxybenzoate polyprenyltransferase
MTVPRLAASVRTRDGRDSRSIGAALLWIYKFVRLPAIGFTAILPVLGAATTGVSLDVRLWMGLLAVAALFHVFAYVHNDVVDLDLDRTEPWRADYPLVQGAIQPRHALLVALLQVPLGFLVSLWIDAGVAALGALAAAFALMAAYNLFGKRCRWPLFTDAVQGLGWCALAVFGGLVAGEAPRGATWLLAAHVFVYVLMVNGVHGSLRDLDNDRRMGARTTAVYFGARRRGDRLVLPRGFIAYGLALQGALVVLALARLTVGWPEGADRSWPVAVALTGGLTVVSVGLLVLVGRAVGGDGAGPASAGEHSAPSSLGFLGALHLAVSLGLLPVLYATPLGGRDAVLTLVVCAVPVLLMWVHNGRRWD